MRWWLVSEGKRDKATRNQQQKVPRISNCEIDDSIQHELSESLEQLCLTQNEPTDPSNAHTSDEHEADQSLTLVKEVAQRIDTYDTPALSVNTEKSQKTNSKENRTSDCLCICSGSEKGGMIRCDWCRKWFHEKCMGIKKKEQIGFWVCTECRKMPKIVLDIQDRIETVDLQQGTDSRSRYENWSH